MDAESRIPTEKRHGAGIKGGLHRSGDGRRRLVSETPCKGFHPLDSAPKQHYMASHGLLCRWGELDCTSVH